MPTLTTEALYKILLDNMGPQHWWPAKSPEEMMLGAILVQNTNWKNADMALMRLREETQFDPQKILSLPLAELQEIIRSSGFIRIRERRFMHYFSG